MSVSVYATTRRCCACARAGSARGGRLPPERKFLTANATLLDLPEQKALCARASGTNAITGAVTRDSLGCR